MTHEEQAKQDSAKAKAATITAERPANIPLAKKPDNIPAGPDDQPKIEEYAGLYVKKDDGEEYALAIKKNALNGRTHFAKNSARSWNDSEAEFDKQFSKK